MSIGKLLESLSQRILVGRFLVGRLGVQSVASASPQDSCKDPARGSRIRLDMRFWQNVGDLWPFCENPVYPDPVWKPANIGQQVVQYVTISLGC